MDKPKVLKVDGSILPSLGYPVIVKRILEHLNSQPEDEVFTYSTLMTVLRRSRTTIYQNAMHHALDGYHATVHSITYWGHPNAIKELLRQHGGADEYK